MTTPRQSLRYARMRRESAARDTEAAAEQTRLAVVAANKAGVPKTEIAELAGVSRQTVYDLLR